MGELANTDEQSLVQTLERMATSPDVDVAKLEKLLDLQERIIDKRAQAAFNQAMSRAQSEMQAVSVDATNPQTRSKYASYKALDKALRPIYTTHGFSLSFDTADCPRGENWVRVVCYISHAEGDTRERHIDLPADGIGTKGNPVMTKTHAAGSAMTYGMRYLLKLVFNVAVGEDDDDGRGAQGIPKITDEQVNELDAMIREHELDREKFLGWLRREVKAENLEDINQNAFENVKRVLQAKIKAQSK